MPETDDARYERMFWLKLINRAQKYAHGDEAATATERRHARMWLSSCDRSGWRARIECRQLLRVGELAGLEPEQVYRLSEKENEENV
jgi:hypothetical protein